MCATFLLLIVGTIVTYNFVEWPEGSGGWNPTETFIYEVFNFNHTCTVLDFNPSRTVSALLMMFLSVPLDLYLILSYYRLKYDFMRGHVGKKLWIYTRITTPFNLLAVTYFYMVFVNPPYDMPSFILHYIPYMCYQIALIFMAIGQCGYLAQMKIIPFNIPRKAIQAYLVFLVVLGIYYTAFIWSHIAGNPIIDTKIESNRKFAVAIMYIFNIFALLIPAVAAFIEAKNGNTQTIQFFNTQGAEDNNTGLVEDAESAQLVEDSKNDNAESEQLVEDSKNDSAGGV